MANIGGIADERSFLYLEQEQTHVCRPDRPEQLEHSPKLDTGKFISKYQEPEFG